MNIPPQVLIALDKLLTGQPNESTPNGAFEDFAYATTGGNWVGLIQESKGRHWFVAPIQYESPTQNDKSPHDSQDEKRTHGEWSWNEAQSLELFNKISPIGLDSRKLIANEAVRVLERDQKSVLCILCDRFNLAAAMLDQDGLPPKIVAEDWRQQLAELKLSASIALPSETLCTDDGILIPLSQTLASVRPATQACAFPTKVVDWPWTVDSQISTNTDSLKNSETGLVWATNSFSSTHTKPKITKKSNSSNAMLKIGLVIAAAACLICLGWFFFPRSSDSSQERLASSGKDTVTPKVPQITNDNSPATSNEPHTSEFTPATEGTVSELTLTESPSMSLEETTDSSTSDNLESLLAELQPKGAKPFSLDGTSSTSIISQALNATAHKEDSPQSSVADSNESIAAPESGTEQEDEPEQDSESGTNAAAPQPLSIEKVLKLAVASKRESIPVGQRVVSRDGECQVQLKLAEGLVVEPSEIVTIAGVGKSVWKIAIEDEDPELLLEIASKPSSRWQIVTTVALRETPTSLPVLFGPTDALTVGNQLLEYNQWISNSISTLQSARSVPRRRSRIDFAGEIQKLERQQKEVERALQRWQIVAKLSHLLYDSNEIQIKLSAPSPSPKPSPESAPQ